MPNSEQRVMSESSQHWLRSLALLHYYKDALSRLRALTGISVMKALVHNLFNSSESTSVDLSQTWNLTPNCQDAWPDFWLAHHCCWHCGEARAQPFCSGFGSVLHRCAVVRVAAEEWETIPAALVTGVGWSALPWGPVALFKPCN